MKYSYREKKKKGNKDNTFLCEIFFFFFSFYFFFERKKKKNIKNRVTIKIRYQEKASLNFALITMTL